MRDADRIRLWELVELLDRELSKPCPDWPKVRATAKELWKRVKRIR